MALFDTYTLQELRSKAEDVHARIGRIATKYDALLESVELSDDPDAVYEQMVKVEARYDNAVIELEYTQEAIERITGTWPSEYEDYQEFSG
jgi:hypothetical protein